MAGSKLPNAPGDVRGRQMGNYEVLCRLSAGGMAEIFLATKRGLAGFHKPVVLKKILPDIQGQEEFVQMFLDEAKVTAAFNHPHIAQVFDLDVDGDELFLAMEFVPGATLIEVARACRAANEPMPVGLGLATVRDTALALHYAHTFTDALGQPSPVIHRDVAEKNIMVTYEGVTKLLDFGIAKSLAGVSRTAVGMVKGTSGYMSPEQILGEPLDARSDLFSLGVVLHECLTGMRLFPGKAPMAVVNAVLKGPIPEPSRTNKAIPPELDAIVLKALARKREDRYATTLEFARALERAVGPLIWLPEQSGELLRRLFAERREQTRQLLASGRAGVDSTGVVKLAQLFSDRDTPATPPASPAVAAPTTPARLPTISAPPLAARGAARPEETDLVTHPLAPRPPGPPPEEKRTASASHVPLTPPPPPEETGVHTPSQPTSRARPARASVDPSTLPSLPVLVERPGAPVGVPVRPPVDPSTLPSLPALVEPPRPLRSPTPLEQSRAAAPAEQTRAEPRRSLSRTDAVPAPQDTREPAPKTAVIRPPRATPTGEQAVTSDETLPRYDATRAARRSSPSHLDAVTQPTGSAPLLPGPSAPPARALLAPESPTVPAARAPLARPPVEPEDEDGPEFRTVPFIAPPAASRPLPAQPRSDADDTEDLTPAHPQPVSRRHLPVRDDAEEEATVSHAPAPPPPGRRVPWAALLILLLMAGFAALVVLRLDGGLLSSRLMPPQPEATAEGSTPAPQATQGKPAPSAAAPAAPEAASGSASPEAAAPTPEATAPESASGSIPVEADAPAPTGVTAATGADSPEAKNEALAATGESAEASPKDEAPQDEAPQAPESAQLAKRGKVAPSRRTQRTPANVETSPEQVTSPGEADRAPQALERERADAAEPTTDGKGSLTLVTEPYAKVYLGSRLLGETPLFRVPLPLGKHTLRLTAPQTKPLKLQVEIKAGEVTSIRTALEKSTRE